MDEDDDVASPSLDPPERRRRDLRRKREADENRFGDDDGEADTELVEVTELVEFGTRCNGVSGSVVDSSASVESLLLLRGARMRKRGRDLPLLLLLLVADLTDVIESTEAAETVECLRGTAAPAPAPAPAAA